MSTALNAACSCKGVDDNEKGGVEIRRFHEKHQQGHEVLFIYMTYFELHTGVAIRVSRRDGVSLHIRGLVSKYLSALDGTKYLTGACVGNA